MEDGRRQEARLIGRSRDLVFIASCSPGMLPWSDRWLTLDQVANQAWVKFREGKERERERERKVVINF
jgi:hypothetical protein